jgi:hypothetical protein
VSLYRELKRITEPYGTLSGTGGDIAMHVQLHVPDFKDISRLLIYGQTGYTAEIYPDSGAINALGTVSLKDGSTVHYFAITFAVEPFLEYKQNQMPGYRALDMVDSKTYLPICINQYTNLYNKAISHIYLYYHKQDDTIMTASIYLPAKASMLYKSKFAVILAIITP